MEYVRLPLNTGLSLTRLSSLGYIAFAMMTPYLSAKRPILGH